MKNTKITLYGILTLILIGSLISCKEKGLSNAVLKADAIRYENVEFDINDPRYIDNPEFQSEYQVTYPKITDDIPEQVKAKINAQIAAMILDTNVAISNFPDINQLAQSLFDSYYESYEDSIRFAGWSVTKNISVASKVGPLLTLVYTEFSFMGGAHPNSHTLYTVFDLTDGSIVSMNDIFDEGKISELNEIKLRAFKEQKNDLDFIQKSDWMDFLFPEEFEEGGNFNTNNNIKIAKDAVYFFYNNYDIAPYAFGSTDLKVALSDLQSVLNKKGKYYKYLKK